MPNTPPNTRERRTHYDKDNNVKTDLDTVKDDEHLDKNLGGEVVEKSTDTLLEEESNDKTDLDIVEVDEPLDKKLVEEVDEKPADTSHEEDSSDDRQEAPRPAHVTTGSSSTPKGRLIKTPKLIANGKRALAWYLLSLIVLGLDQWTKWLAETKLNFQDPVPVVEPFLNWTLAYNYGAAFSFLADAGGWQKWFFSGLALIMSIFLIGYLIKAPRQAKLLSVGLALVLGGAIGNLIDRLLHGHVIDFIHIHNADVWHYPIFNIADMSISIGVALIIIDMLFLEKKRSS